ncbi:hypothetical protein E1B28_006291 [Marasmius oreades]|uniref:Uncharacterized protein n=1 Tax=Marasmius oreades TaxID=181124 RepID=A0A9P7UWC9_9AGAR|nr:uncharacterized protein E1B28_006291 [Marasmius oreades]KAG7095554.1 hypothetical protein E1B28_006291 [Marasmius oreades]
MRVLLTLLQTTTSHSTKSVLNCKLGTGALDIRGLMKKLKLDDADSRNQPQPRLVAAKSISLSYQSNGGSAIPSNKRLKSSAKIHISSATSRGARKISDNILPKQPSGSGSSQTRPFLTISAKTKTPRRQPQTVLDDLPQGSSQLPLLIHESPRNSRHRLPLVKSTGGSPTARKVSIMNPQEDIESKPSPIAMKTRSRIPPRHWNEDTGDYDETDLGILPSRTRIRIAAASAQPTQIGTNTGHHLKTVVNADSVDGLGGYLDENFQLVHRSRVPSDENIELFSTEESDAAESTRIGNKLPRKLTTLAKKSVPAAVMISGSDESEESNLDVANIGIQDVHHPRARPAPMIKAARKSACTTALSESDDSGPTSSASQDESDSGSSDIQVNERQVLPTSIRTLRRNSSLILPPSLKIRNDTSPTTELVQALKGCVVRLPEMRLPFLRRNLRVGFERKCEVHGIGTMSVMISDSERVSVETVYLYPIGNLDGTSTRYGSLTKGLEAWTCPLCLLHLNFANRDMLQKHLEWDHSEAKVRWTESRDELRQTVKWTIKLVLPKPNPKALTGSRDPHTNCTFATYPHKPAFSEPHRSPHIKDVLVKKGKAREVSMVSELSKAPSTSRDSTATDSRSTTTDCDPTQPKKRSVSPPMLEFDEDPRDPLGPTAQYPFLPAQSEDGTITLNYSCRIGGPKIYDLLGTLSLEPFGVLSWVVLDREEEIFEVDDVKDEHKVMHALWARWIFLNRTTFIKNYLEGVRMFIDEYWKMIQLAAGWEALRYWLIVLLANRFLTGHEVAQLLKYYQGKIGWAELA